MASTRKPRSRRGSATRGRGARRAPARRRPTGLRTAFDGLEQRHLDLLGLAATAFGVYSAFVLYLGWDGGPVGGWLEVALAHAVGRVEYLVPVVVFGLGVALVARPMLLAPRALNVGTILVLAAILLAFAGAMAGLGAPRSVDQEPFQPSYFTEHGGALGEALYWAATTLFQRLGAQIIAALLLVCGLLLLTGTTVANLLGKAGGAARRARATTREVARTVRDTSPTHVPWHDPPGEEIVLTRAAATEPLAQERDGAWDEEDVAAEPDEEDDGGAGPPFAYDDEAEEVVPGGEEEVFDPGEASSDARTPMGNRRDGVTASDEIEYVAPSAKVLERGKADQGMDPRERELTARSLLEALAHFGVEARLLGTVSGPHVSRYELQLAPGTKVGKVAQLKDDLAYALASTDIRILAPIPGKKAVGVEVPNARRRLVRLGDIYEGRPKNASPLAAWLGKDVAGHAVWTDLALMPHALVAGTTGSGKSGCINAILTSILLHASPNEVRLVLVDPKQVELNHYETLPHLLTPVVTNPRLAANVLANLIGEMESRYGVMGEAKARNLAELNKVRRREGEPPLPHILCVIDELADLMMVAPAEVEDSIIRLAQKSRAVGIHLLLATQRPSTDVITGTIKVNIPARIAFSVASQVDSRVILDQGGAETLLGQGDMLFRPIGTSKLQRIQGAFVGEDEIARIARHWAKQGEPEFDPELLASRPGEASEPADGEFSPDQDDLLADAARMVVENGTASVSMIQRRLRVGYTRAGRLIDMLERRGIISGHEGSKPRQVLVSLSDLPRVLGDGGPQPVATAPREEPGTETELEPVER